MHPYTQLPPASFWKTAIADIEPKDIQRLWQPKFPVSRETKILTAGSCFAQHISRALGQKGFSWIDSEPAPADLPHELHAENGYGVFSFRTGNIYTAALLRQWIFWALGLAQPGTEIFEQNGRYHDPFRPAFPPGGYASPEELLQARSATLQAIKGALQQADVFIFTLGLTEAWKNAGGDIYPMCPGTLRGEFSEAVHKFHNFCEPEIMRDLNEAFDALRKLNPRIRFLLTVSPVPLTATASGQHVLVANTYSKSVLRSVAGHLAQTREDVDYFPSFELIATPPYKGQFFEKNMRSVTAEGVAFVMSQFLAGIDPAHAEPAAPSRPETQSSMASRIAPGDAAGGNEICEDIILETWANRPVRDKGESPNIVLIGDSQMGMMAKALDSLDIPYEGGAIMQASGWHNLNFIDDDDRLFMPTDPEARDRWETAYQRCLSTEARASNRNPWIITNIGTHSPIMISKNGLDAYLRTIYGNVPYQLMVSDLKNYLTHAREHHLKLVRKMVKAGFNVIWVTDPPTQTSLTEIFSAFDTILSEYFGATGCAVFNAREWIDRLGGMPQEYRATEIDAVTGRPDEMHGGLEYYRQLAQEIFKAHAIRPA